MHACLMPFEPRSATGQSAGTGITSRVSHKFTSSAGRRGRETRAERGASPKASDLCWSSLLPKNSLAWKSMIQVMRPQSTGCSASQR